MRKLLFILICLAAIYNYQAKPPYEATWLQITKKDSSYIVYSRHLEYAETNSLMKIIIKNNSIEWVTTYEPPLNYRIKIIKDLDNESYLLEAHPYFKFEWVDKEKYIARWTIYYIENKPISDYLYIDSLYNSYPIEVFRYD